MSEKNITFLSNRGAGMNSDLKLVESKLVDVIGEDDFAFRFFLKNERRKNPMAKQGIVRAKKEFCQEITNAICVDASLTRGMGTEAGVKLLLASPYDYLFKNELIRRGRKGKPGDGWKAFQNFTHIIPGSPFAAQLIKDAYQLHEVSVLEDICLPFVWEINRPERQREIKKKIAFYFPAVEEKKLLAVLVFGDKGRNTLRGLDFKKLMASLGEEWFLLTNMEELMEAAYSLGSEYRNSFGYINRMFPGQDILYVADALVTNNGSYAAYFASRHKPLYCIAYRNNFFEKYMRQYHPKMYFRNLRDIVQMDFDVELPPGQAEFDRFFSYRELKSPYKMIASLLREKGV